MKVSKPPTNGLGVLEERFKGGEQRERTREKSCKLVCLPISAATGRLTKVAALHCEPPWLWRSAEGWRGKRLSSSQGSVARTHLGPAALQSCGPVMPNRGAPEGALTLM